MSDQPTNVSTDLVLKVYETTPAVVSFNYQEIANHLDSVLAKYRGLVFTDSTIVECKKTIAELRKGQKSLDEFRISTKKKLTASVTDFEKECKTLHSKFEEVIKPLSEQQDQFELDRREKKRVEIQSIIDALVTEKALNEKFAARLVILEEYFNKGKAIKAIKTELSTLATSLKVQQDKEAQDEDLIKTKVELANAQYQLTNVLRPGAYSMLLSYKSIAEIESLIVSDAQEVQDLEKKAAEALAAKAAEVPKIEEVIIPQTFTASKSASIKKPVVITRLYRITGTEDQLNALEGYLGENDLPWVSLPDEDEDDDDFMN